MNDKIQPHNEEVERSLLGMVLLSEEVIPSIISSLEPRDFYNPHHREIYTEISTLFNSGKSVDIVTIANGLKDRGTLESIGGIPYLSNMTDIVASWTSVPDYCRIIKDKCKARDLIKLSTEAMARCYSNELITTTINDIGSKFFAISADKAKEAKLVGNIVGKVFTEIEERFNADSNLAGLETGFVQLDKILSGLQQTDLIILAGRPSMGKTALAMNVARHVGTQDKKVLVFSLEMSKERLVKRMLSDISMVNYNAILNGFLNDSTWKKITHARGVIDSMPIMIDDSPGLSIVELRARAKMVSMRHGVDLIVVDYMQLMHDKANNREREIAQISLGLKGLAKELEVPIVVLSQLNRSLENRPDKRPIMSDLRDSGCLHPDTSILCQNHKVGKKIKDIDNDGAGAVYSNMRKCGNVLADNTKMFRNGVKKMYKMSLTSGHSIIATKNHKFLTPGRVWTPLGDMEEGTMVGVPLNFGGISECMTDSELMILATFIGDGKRCGEKSIFGGIFNLSSAKRCLFLRYLWATDGCVFTGKSGNRNNIQIYYSTISRKLAVDVQLLLQSVGILSIIGETKNEKTISYSIKISSRFFMEKFINQIGVAGGRRAGVVEKCKKVISKLRAGWTKYELSSDNSIVYVPIKNISYHSMGEVYDLQVEDTHNFFANGIIAHNSIEQDADVVAFVYRDEVYNKSPDNPLKGTAELIIAKQRNGAIGKVKLAFLGQFMRFENLAERESNDWQK